MVKVRAITKGYIDLILREPGDVFEWPDGVKLGSWVKPVGKVDETVNDKPSDDRKLSDMTVPELRDLAEARGVDLTGITKKADIVKALEGGGAASEPFGDAPEPIRVENEINTLTGGTEPDWIAPPGGDAPVAVDE